MHSLKFIDHIVSFYLVAIDLCLLLLIKGADDTLVKLWSTRDGHLIATLRGHSAQITDISINMENTLLASGSLDKVCQSLVFLSYLHFRV